MAKAPRDVERIYSTPDVVAKLRRLADALESGTRPSASRSRGSVLGPGTRRVLHRARAGGTARRRSSSS